MRKAMGLFKLKPRSPAQEQAEDPAPRSPKCSSQVLDKNLSENLSAKIPPKGRGIIKAIRAFYRKYPHSNPKTCAKELQLDYSYYKNTISVVKSRLQGQAIEDIASDVGLSRDAVYNALDKKPDDVTKPRERGQLVVSESVLERDVGVNVDEESQGSNPLGPLIVGGILVGIPLGIFALWFLGNLTTRKLKV